MKIMLGFLNTNSGTIQALATLILVIITGTYAFFTYKMAKLMARQVISEIKVSNLVLGSQFVEGLFLERLKNRPEEINKDSYFKFKLLFDIYNKSSGNGSIEKPVLILKFTNDNFEHEIMPITKNVDWENTGDIIAGGTVSKRIVTDLGGTIFLRGGEFQKIELEYTLYDFSEELLINIKKNLNSLEYFIKFSDNLNRNYLLKIKKIQPERKTYRR